LLAVAPHEHAIGNCVRRVLYAVRDNCVPKPSGSVAEVNRKKSKQPVSRSLLTAPIANIDYHSITCTQDILGAVSEIIKEIMEDVQSLESNGSEHAVNNFFRTKDVILTSGHSKTVLDFLQFAAKLGLEFEVLVAEAAPGYSGHKMAQELVNFGFKATLIADSAVHAVMPRVHKVVVGAHLVTVDGGLIAQSGTLNMALAAQAHAVPFVVTAGLYKVCPAYAFDQDSFNDALAPWQMVDFLDNTFVQHVDIDNPAFDCVPPTLIALFVTSVQAKDHKENREAMIVGYQPSHLRALTADMYSPEDFEL
jgi:translation initiation factor eIF-2B subunit beta